MKFESPAFEFHGNGLRARSGAAHRKARPRRVLGNATGRGAGPAGLHRIALTDRVKAVPLWAMLPA